MTANVLLLNGRVTRLLPRPGRKRGARGGGENAELARQAAAAIMFRARAIVKFDQGPGGKAGTADGARYITSAAGDQPTGSPRMTAVFGRLRSRR